MISRAIRNLRSTRGASAAALVALVVAGCSREGRAPAAPEQPFALPVDVYADTGRSTVLRLPPAPRPGAARAAVWLATVSPARAPAPDPPAPEASSETLAVAVAPPPRLAVDEDLKPPLPRSSTPLRVPPGARGSVELDVRIDEQGAVSDALWAGGSDDPALVEAATRCALEMRFYPALRAGHPVAVWCRQRFDFGPGAGGAAAEGAPR
jgi:TonB family protein